MCYLISDIYIGLLDKDHDQKQLKEERVDYILQFSDHSLSLKEDRAGTQGRNLETEAR